MNIIEIHLKQFRCFSSLHLTFESPIVLIEGINGSGKTSLLEALYYAGHLRSFKTSYPKEMIFHDSDSFFVKVNGVDDEPWVIQAGYSQQKKSIKINDVAISTYQELYTNYRTISITEDDMSIVQGAPEVRRSFLDLALSFTSMSYRALLKTYRRVLEQRNALLAQHVVSEESYVLWTEQLESLTTAIQEQRKLLLIDLETTVNNLLFEYCSSENIPAVSFKYLIKRRVDEKLKLDEYRFKKTLFGAHLDDFSFLLEGRPAKIFASRGQQKLLTVLLKVAMGYYSKESFVLLLDDFVTDFDEARITALIRLLHATKAQLIFTTPVTEGLLHKVVAEYPHQIIRL